MTIQKKLILRTTVRLPEDVHNAAKVGAALRGEPLQDFIAHSVRVRLRSMGMEEMLKPQHKRAFVR